MWLLVAFLAGVGSAACEPTLPSALGPVYLPGAPFKKDICPASAVVAGVWQSTAAHPYLLRERLDMNATLLVTGTVRSSGPGCGALEGAEVDVWQADATGVYGALNGDRGYCRGVVKTDAAGRYEFVTQQPGAYGTTRAWLGGSRWIPDLPPWGPRHLHMVVWHPAHRLGVFQIYFEGDPARDFDWRVIMAGDRSLFRAKSSLLTMAVGRSGSNGSFDLALEPLRPGVAPYASREEAARGRCPVEEVGVPALCRPLLAALLRPETVYAGAAISAGVLVALIRLLLQLARGPPRDRPKRD